MTVPSKGEAGARGHPGAPALGATTLCGPVSSKGWSGQFLRPEPEASLSIHIRKRLTSRCLLCAAVVALAVVPVATAGQDVAGAPPVFTTPKKQPPKPEKLPEDLGKIRVQSPLVSTPVTALEASGEFVYDLDEDEFQIFDNGLPQKIERFEVSSDPIAVVIVIQTNDAVEPLLDHVRPLGSVFSAPAVGRKRARRSHPV